jgi:hypothetical protein
MAAYHCAIAVGQKMPDFNLRRKIERDVAKSSHEHLIVFTTADSDTQIWQWVKNESGKPSVCREHRYDRQQPGDALLQKLAFITFTIDEEGRLSLTDVTRRARAGFDVEKVTKQFYKRFQNEHAAFLKMISGISDTSDGEWYASLILNRLMFIYFIQRKGFLDGDRDYLRNRLKRMRSEHGKNQFYSFYQYFLLRLFHEGLGAKKRSSELEALIGRIPYLNGGLFDIHELEKPDRYGDSIKIPDRAFERIFDLFDQYQWNLDERPLRADDEINPDVLGYIFEKYINQKQMGAYYTKEDITEYISRNTVIPALFDAARETCRIAFESPEGPTIWDLLKNAPDRYIYPSVRHGVALNPPPEIAEGVKLRGLSSMERVLDQRKAWNKSASDEYSNPAETWREVMARRAVYQETLRKLKAGEIHRINDLITLNLDIRQFAQDVIETCEGPELLRSIWHAIERIAILDPTCGSGAFLFAALNVLESLYEACIIRMEAFVEDAARAKGKLRADSYPDFREVLGRIAEHPNRRYFILKSIILNNLFGVDVMEEAAEICKLRMFLKLAAQVEPDASKNNFGIEPLPDIDFNIRSGNTLVGFATFDEAKTAIGKQFDFDNMMQKISSQAEDIQSAFDAFRQSQTCGNSSSAIAEKRAIQAKYDLLKRELNITS